MTIFSGAPKWKSRAIILFWSPSLPLYLHTSLLLFFSPQVISLGVSPINMLSSIPIGKHKLTTMRLVFSHPSQSLSISLSISVFFLRLFLVCKCSHVHNPQMCLVSISRIHIPYPCPIELQLQLPHSYSYPPNHFNLAHHYHLSSLTCFSYRVPQSLISHLPQFRCPFIRMLIYASTI